MGKQPSNITKHFQWPPLIGITLGFFFGFAAVSLFGPTTHYLRTTIGLSPALIGLLISIPSLLGALLRIPFAAWVDRAGGRKPFLVLFFIAFVGILGISFILTFASNTMIKNLYPLLVIFGALAGCGIATFSVGIAQTSYWFTKKNQGFALGFYGGAGNLSPGIITFVLTFALLPVLSISNIYWIWVAIIGVGIIVYFFLGSDAPYFKNIKKGMSPQEAKEKAMQQGQVLFPNGKAFQSLGHSAQFGTTWILVFIYFLTFGGFLALVVWLPSYGSNYLHLSLRSAGIMATIYALLSALIRVFGGKLADLMGGLKTVVIFLLITLVGSILMTSNVISSFPFALIGIIFMGAGMGIVNAGVFKLMPLLTPQCIGGSAGWVGGLGALGGFVLPNLLTLFITNMNPQIGYPLGYILYVFLSVVALILCIFLYKPIKRALENQKMNKN